MKNRRQFMKSSLYSFFGLGVFSMEASLLAASASVGGRKPMRFIFIRKSSGLIPEDLLPPSFSDADKATDKKRGELDIDLKNHELPAFMKPVESLRENTTILQGLSGKMMTLDGHWPRHSCLALVNGTGRSEDLVRASMDFELAKLCPSPFNHIGFSAANAHVGGIQPGNSVKAPGQTSYEYCTPQAAYADIFGSISSNADDQAAFKVRENLMQFATSRQKAKTENAVLAAVEKQKIESYTQATEDLYNRSGILKSMSAKLKECAPDLEERFLSSKISTSDKQTGHAEIAVAALIAGVTNVVTLDMDNTNTIYPELELEGGSVHDIGHGKTLNKIAATDARAKIREQHMKCIALMADKLKQVPEGDGTMFDNTMIFYLTDNGEKHHPTCYEWPFMVFSGKNANLKIEGRYIRLPKHGEQGHRTLGNWYTTILNAYGNPMEHYGNLDTGLERMKFDQVGAIKEFLA